MSYKNCTFKFYFRRTEVLAYKDKAGKIQYFSSFKQIPFKKKTTTKKPNHKYNLLTITVSCVIYLIGITAPFLSRNY